MNSSKPGCWAAIMLVASRSIASCGGQDETKGCEFFPEASKAAAVTSAICNCYVVEPDHAADRKINTFAYLEVSGSGTTKSVGVSANAPMNMSYPSGQIVGALVSINGSPETATFTLTTYLRGIQKESVVVADNSKKEIGSNSQLYFFTTTMAYDEVEFTMKNSASHPEAFAVNVSELCVSKH